MFKIVDTNTTKIDSEKLIVEETTNMITTGTFTLADLEASLERWKETLRQANENILKIEARIVEVKKLFKP